MTVEELIYMLGDAIDRGADEETLASIINENFLELYDKADTLVDSKLGMDIRGLIVNAYVIGKERGSK